MIGETPKYVGVYLLSSDFLGPSGAIPGLCAAIFVLGGLRSRKLRT